jgi:hypothetical protein
VLARKIVVGASGCVSTTCNNTIDPEVILR